ncbi:MAG: rhodanese-like domain-containing protein [Flavobacterium sp.]|nr:rhodanese-like domain-containing protein [Flavobacterium sp.]
MRFIKALFLLISSSLGFAQITIPEVLNKLNKKTVPYITVSELKENQNVILLDAREFKEYHVSHLQNAVPVGFNTFDIKKTETALPDKNAIIVVYCSIGVRSEKIGEKLLKSGYKKVYNLYGGIFEWKNNDGKTINSNNVLTDSVHTYNKTWSVYLKKGIKVY